MLLMKEELDDLLEAAESDPHYFFSPIDVLEEQVDVANLVTDLTSEGASTGVAESVSRALATVSAGPTGNLSKVIGGDTGLDTL